eukprot:403703-Pleurochrysis_carterae.AAC.1
MRRRDFIADHAQEEVGVDEYGEKAAARLRMLHARRGARGQAQGGGAHTAQPTLYLASDVAEQARLACAARLAA